MTIETLRSAAADPNTLKTMTDAEVEALSTLQNQFANEARSQAYGKYVEPIRLAAQALGFPSGWHTTPEYVAAAAAAEAELAADADYQLVHFSSPLYYALVRESRRRRSNASRAASAAKRAELAVEAGTFAMGEKVQVYAFGRWYNGEVVKFGRTGKVSVKYTTGTGKTYEKAVLSSMIRKA